MSFNQSRTSRADFRVCGSSLVIAAILLGSGAVHAQEVRDPAEADIHRSGEIQEIIVTATKREQNVSDVGISVSVLGGEALSNMGISDSVDIVNAIPNLENAAVFGPGSNTNFSIRGVAQNDYSDGTESPNALYLDDVYLVPTAAGSFPLYDMERVEVLRGPQGTLFGRNSTGGLIHFITAKPTRDFSASIAGRYGSYDTRRLTGILNVPIGETLSVRLSGQYHKNDGWLKHVTGSQPDRGSMETKSIRGQIRWDPTSNITNILKVSFDKASGNQTAVIRDAAGLNPVTGDVYVLAPGEDFYGTGPNRDAFGQGSKRLADNNVPTRLLGARSTNVMNKLEIDLGNVTVTSVTGYNKMVRAQVEDCDYTQISVCSTYRDNKGRQYSEELRLFADLGRTRITAGAYYLNHKITLDENAPLLLNTPSAFAIRVNGRQKSKSYALFGNVEFDLTPQLTLIAGLRGSKDKKHFQQVISFLAPADPANPFPNNASVRPRDQVYGPALISNIFTDATVGRDATHINKNTWTAKLELDYRPNDDTLIYGSFSRGVKSPGFNNGIIDIGTPVSGFSYKAETLLAYEAGAKVTFADRRANLNVAAFYYDYNNFHTLTFEGVGSFTTNRDARLFGAEAELTVLPVDGLTIKLNGGLLDTKLKDVANTGGIVADREMPLAAPWTIGGSVRYEMNVGVDDYRLGFQVDGRARDGYYNQPGNESAGRVQSVALFNGRIDLTDAENRFEVGVSANNIFDKRYTTINFLLQGLGGFRYGNLGPPRWVALDLKYNFK